MTSSDYTASSWNNVSAVMRTANELIAQGEGVADEALVESTLESLINAKSALVLANAGLSYAVKGKTTIVGVADSGRRHHCNSERQVLHNTFR